MRFWDLSKYDGIELQISEADAKEYTLILKDELLPRDSQTGREQSTLSFEHNFRIPLGQESNKDSIGIWIPWNEFKATYRGKDREDARDIDLRSVRRFSIMARRQVTSRYLKVPITLS